MVNEFLSNMPSRNVRNFSGLTVIPKDENKIKVAYNVTAKKNEQKIVNDNKPTILRFLESHYPKKEQGEAQVVKKEVSDPLGSLPDGKHKKATRKK